MDFIYAPHTSFYIIIDDSRYPLPICYFRPDEEEFSFYELQNLRIPSDGHTLTIF